MTNWVILLVVAVCTLAALLVCTMLWANAARRVEPQEDYRR